jgi:hypothetical protein
LHQRLEPTPIFFRFEEDEIEIDEDGEDERWRLAEKGES